MTRVITYEDGTVVKDAVNWSEVDSVFGFKLDIFAYDLICIGFRVKERWVEVAEDMEGWETLIDALLNYLPGMPCDTDWWEKIVQPPFATNWTTLYTRKSE